MHNIYKSFFSALLVFSVALLAFTQANAQQGSNFAADDGVDPIVTDFQYFYDEMNMAKLSKLYWRLGAMNVEIEDHVDNFMRINECDIYKDYYLNEFEWSGIHKKAKNFLTEEQENFPIRFKFVQPLRLEEYNLDKQTFEVLEEFELKSITNFEVLATDFNEPICTEFSASDIKHYPRGLYITLSQPFTITEIPMSPQRAQKYVNDKMEVFRTLTRARQTKENLYRYRDAYIIMKVRVFAHKGERFASYGNYNSAHINAVLEGFEVYADRDHTELLYFENYLRKSKTEGTKVRLQKEYEALKKRRQNLGNN